MDIKKVLSIDLGDPERIGFVGSSYGTNAKPDRNPAGKWYQAPDGTHGWAFTTYADFPHGVCYFVSRKLACLINLVAFPTKRPSEQVKQDLRKIQGEDVSLGIWNYFFAGTIKNIPQLLPGCNNWVQHLESGSSHIRYQRNFEECGNPCKC